RERIGTNRRLRQIEHRRYGERGVCLQDAIAKMSLVHALPPGRAEKRVTHGFYAAPVARQKVLVLLVPKRHGCGHLRRRGRRTLPVLTDCVLTLKHRPGDVGRVGSDRRGHTAVRPPTALYIGRRDVVVWLAVRHYAAN